MRWPLNDNKFDACCACGAITGPCPDPKKFQVGETGLTLWLPEPTSPPQYICSSCLERFNTQGLFSIQQVGG